MRNFKIGLFFYLFCYVFAFYIGPISISLIIAIPLYINAFLNKSFFNELVFVASSRLIWNVSKLWLILVFISLLYPIIFFTLDYSFFRVVAMQMIHLFAAIPFFAYLKYNKYTSYDIEKYFIYIFIVQTFIQLIVVSSPLLGEKILFFNHYEPEAVLGAGSNIRGKALSAATTYHLTIAYGICFIVYIKHLLDKKITIKTIFVGAMIFIGIFFAGRSGFMGCLIGAIGFLIYNRTSIYIKIKTISKTLMYLSFIIIVSCSILIYKIPSFWELVTEDILPYAFEFVYSIGDKGGVETASTNHLFSMWTDSDFNYLEFFFGSGKYSNSNGTYYMEVDPGILRHLLFMGIIGYVILIIYQLTIFPIWKMKYTSKYYYYLILIFIIVMDLKAVTIGLNKFVFAITLLFSFCGIYLKHDIKNEKLIS